MGTGIEQISQETIDLTKSLFGKSDIEKGITVSGTTLYGYNLEQPAKRLYPVLSPLRNRIARSKAPVGAIKAEWKSITGINTANIKASVAFGARQATAGTTTGTIAYGRSDRSSAYKTFGLDDSVDDEGVWFARGFEDVRALSALATLQAVMIEEEKILLGGLNSDMALGTTGTPTVAVGQVTGGAGWTSTQYVHVRVMALPLYGVLNWALSQPAFAPATTGYATAPADHGIISAAANVQMGSVTVDQMFASVAPKSGAFAYVWFVGQAASGSEPSALYAHSITYMPTQQILSLGTAAGLDAKAAASTIWAAASGPGTDTSGDPNAFDGLIPQILPPTNTLTTLATYTNSAAATVGTLSQSTGDAGSLFVSGALVYDMGGNGVALAASADGRGVALTADNAGGIVEFDIVLKALWDKARIGPSLILINSQEALRITQRIGGSSNLAMRVVLKDGDKEVIGGIYVSQYLNKFSSSLTPGNPDVIPMMIHPFMPPGTIVFISEKLPYPDNRVNQVLEMELQQEYSDFEWARIGRRYEHGVYANGTLKHYFPAGCALIRGCKDA